MRSPWQRHGSGWHGMDAGNAMGLNGDVVHERAVVWCRAAGPTYGFKKTLGRAPTKVNVAGRGSITGK